MNFGLDKRYLGWPGTEEVTVRLKRQPTVNITITHALAQSADTRELQAAGIGAKQESRTWHVPIALLTVTPNETAEIQPGDKVICASGANAGTWHVTACAKLAKASKWRCLCTLDPTNTN